VNNLKIYYLQEELIFRFQDSIIMLASKLMLIKKKFLMKPEELLELKEKV
jgi:hypothetical protein